MSPVRAALKPAAHPLLTDALLALGVTLVAGLSDTFGHDARSVASVFWDIGLAAPLVLRRRTPAAAAALVAAICLAQWLAGVLANGDFAVLIILYTLGAWESRRWLLAAAAVVAELGVVMAVTRWASGHNQWLTALMVTGTVTSAWVIGLYVRTRRAYLVSMIERAESAERDRDRSAQLAVADERARMAREMHDIIAHSLAVMVALNDGVAAVSAPGKVQDTVTQASEVGRQALGEMQRMLGVLRGVGGAELVPQPGITELADLISIVRSADLSIELAISGDVPKLEPTAQLAIYRIVQESLTNVLKHARNVRRVVVAVTYSDDRACVSITNDGDPGGASSTTSSGHGLAGMRERAAAYGGQFHAGPLRGGGWEVVVELRAVSTAVAA